VFFVSFNVSNSDRVSGKFPATATFSFLPSTAIVSGGSITLNFPSLFFAPGVIPSSAICSAQNLSLIVQATSNRSLILTVVGTSNDAVAAGTSVIITVFGLTMGSATSGSLSGITVQTSADAAVSLAAASGPINSVVSAVAISIATADRIAGNNNATIILEFKPYSVIAVGGTITMKYPNAFLAPDVTPSCAGSSVPGIDFIFQPTKNTSIVLTTIGTPVPVAIFTVTMTGFTMGAAADYFSTGVSVQTSVDVGISLPADAGSIYISLVPVAVSASPAFPFAGSMLTVHGHSFILPGSTFNCSARIGPVASTGMLAPCSIFSSSIALVQVPGNVLATPAFVQLHFDPINVTSTVATPLCVCAYSSGGKVCGCSANSCSIPL
jgi:hypothetical protein